MCGCVTDFRMYAEFTVWLWQRVIDIFYVICFVVAEIYMYGLFVLCGMCDSLIYVKYLYCVVVCQNKVCLFVSCVLVWLGVMGMVCSLCGAVTEFHMYCACTVWWCGNESYELCVFRVVVSQLDICYFYMVVCQYILCMLCVVCGCVAACHRYGLCIACWCYSWLYVWCVSSLVVWQLFINK